MRIPVLHPASENVRLSFVLRFSTNTKLTKHNSTQQASTLCARRKLERHLHLPCHCQPEIHGHLTRYFDKATASLLPRLPSRPSAWLPQPGSATPDPRTDPRPSLQMTPGCACAVSNTDHAIHILYHTLITHHVTERGNMFALSLSVSCSVGDVVEC